MPNSSELHCATKTVTISSDPGTFADRHNPAAGTAIAYFSCFVCCLCGRQRRPARAVGLTGPAGSEGRGTVGSGCVRKITAQSIAKTDYL